MFTTGPQTFLSLSEGILQQPNGQQCLFASEKLTYIKEVIIEEEEMIMSIALCLLFRLVFQSSFLMLPCIFGENDMSEYRHNPGITLVQQQSGTKTSACNISPYQDYGAQQSTDHACF